MAHGFERPEHEEIKNPRGKPLGLHISSCSCLSDPCTPRTHQVTVTSRRFFFHVTLFFNVFNFSEVHRSVNYIGVTCNINEHRRGLVNFASDRTYLTL